MNNIYGVIGIGVKNSMFNADFNGEAKTDFAGNIIASPYALQYCIKNQWNLLGEDVLGLKRVQEDGTYLTLESVFTQITGLDAKSDYNIILERLMKFKDVKNFGCVYSVKGKNISVKGAVQFGVGVNKYEDTITYNDEVLSPYASKDGKDNTTIGNKNLLNEAHYVYDFSIFADEYKNLNNVEYSEEDYIDFKNNLLICVSNCNSKAKKGCKNEFAAFVEVNEGYNYITDLGFLEEYINVIKEDDKIIYDLKEFTNLIKDLEGSVKGVEIYYNPRTVSIENIADEFKIYDLITRKAVK
ncbi:TPA: type I CRISPR-associated protein Cas7 [Clostridium perfringens]|uniref:Type I CRISPR-associated protein Cas7 n=2 Tax=Clostridium perfringens TaxID=1502 RepID=A0A8H9UX57_CLOPF|nr:type I CRISPR-associated protein Cas7 [Clostridium perfringens]EDT15837.1 conserved hypothetical protein [Clostridium perfringens E str. JGS1987]MCX0407815.1 type I CRISPR-associated protein Cas7 [Clostridium perfringens]HAT4308284.1 type I CRISPR-associated protein Cas7 [Clostridium perfringens]